MKKCEINQIIKTAKLLNKENKKWHYHMLGKDCIFNDEKGKFNIIFEIEKTNEVLFSIFNEKPLLDSKKLADMMYGQNFLDIVEKDNNKNFDSILKKAESLTERKIEWHHHHLHPNCIFNKYKGKHCIVLEDPETNQVLTAVYDKKPMSDLVKLEKLFYKDL